MHDNELADIKEETDSILDNDDDMDSIRNMKRKTNMTEVKVKDGASQYLSNKKYEINGTSPLLNLNISKKSSNPFNQTEED